MPRSPLSRNSEKRYDRVSFTGRKASAPVVTAPAIRSRPEELAPSPLDQAFLRCVLREAGIDPAGYRLAPLLRRIPYCLRRLRADSVRSAMRLAEKNPELWAAAADALLIGATSFFRDAPVFEVLDSRVIPTLLQHTRRPRIWSAACSDGAELYSVAMRFLESDPACHPVLHGTDCREVAIRTASAGIYPSAQLAAAPEKIRQRFFKVEGERGLLRFRQELTPDLTWAVADLAQPRPPSQWDLILCRNLAIYLTPFAARQLWQQLWGELEPGGFLVVGKADKPTVPGLIRIAPSVYQRNF